MSHNLALNSQHFSVLFHRLLDWRHLFFHDVPLQVPAKEIDKLGKNQLCLPNAPLEQVVLDSILRQKADFTSEAERESKVLMELEMRVESLVSGLIEEWLLDRYLDEAVVNRIVCKAENLKLEVFGIEVELQLGRPECYLFLWENSSFD